MKKLLLITICVISIKSHAQIPVTDGLSLIQALESWVTELEGLANQGIEIQNQVEQIQQARERLSAITGAKDIAQLLNSKDFKELRRVIPGDTLDIIEDISKGNLPKTNRDYKKVIGKIYDIYPVLEKDSLKGKTPRQVTRLKNDVIDRDKSISLTATSTYYAAAQAAQANIQTVEALIDEIDNTEDLKAALDLNSRIMGEVAIQINQLIKIQAMDAATYSERRLIQEQIQTIQRSRNNIKVD